MLLFKVRSGVVDKQRTVCLFVCVVIVTCMFLHGAGLELRSFVLSAT